MVDPTPFEVTLDELIEPIWAEGKSGDQWGAVDAYLKDELELPTESRTKRASSSGRLSNVIVESNDKPESFYLILLAPQVSVPQAVRRLRKDVARFPNVKNVAIADHSLGMWRIRALVEEVGVGVSERMGPKLTALEEVVSVEPDYANVEMVSVAEAVTGIWIYELPEGEDTKRVLVINDQDPMARYITPGDTVLLITDTPDGPIGSGVGRVLAIGRAGEGLTVELDPLYDFGIEPVELDASFNEGLT